MTRNEFENLVKVSVSAKEYEAIEIVYMSSDVDKFEFCKMWAKINASRVKAAADERAAAEKKQAEKWEMSNIYWRVYWGLSYDDKCNKMAWEVLSNKERALLTRYDIDTVNTVTCNMLYNLSLILGIK